MLPATNLERCRAWYGQGRAALREKTEFRAVLSSCVHLVDSSTLATPWPVYWRELTAAILAPLSGLGMIHRCGPCTSGIVTTAGGGPQKHSFFYTSSQDHVNYPSLLDCGQKTPPGHLVAQGQWQCSHPVLRHEACSSALISSFLHSRAISSFSHRPHRCYLLCWPRCGAAEPRLGIPKASCMSISSVSSAVIC